MKIWSDKKYYEKIAESEKFDHPGFIKARQYCQNAKTILDVGCGDGSKLKKLGNAGTKRFGCEVSALAAKFGYDKYDGLNLPYKSNNFDRVVSFFVLEHTLEPKKLLEEMVRVLKINGLMIILAPNFGAPNRASPNFVGSRIIKIFRNPQWHKVKPKIDSMKGFESDLDTTFEPYLDSIVKYLQSLQMKIIEKSSFWEMEKKDAKVIQKIFKYIFQDWGPHLFVVARKV